MTPRSTRSTRSSWNVWAGLPSDLLLAIAQLSDDPTRLAVMRTCRRWRATMLEEPELWPMTVLRFPEPRCDIWDDSSEDEDAGCGCPECNPLIYVSEASEQRRDMRLQLRRDMAAGVDVVRAAAQLDPRTVRVRLEGSGDQSVAMCGVLHTLPASLTELEVEVDWQGPILQDLRRFSQLRDLRLVPSISVLLKGDWAHFAAVASKVTALRLEYVSDTVPVCAPKRLAEATRLQALTISAGWSDDLDAVCRALPALNHLDLSLHKCTSAHAEAAAAMLGALPNRCRVGLTISSCETEFDGDEEFLTLDEWQHWACLRALAHLPIQLTALELVGAASLPPDWHQLAQLQRLVVHSSRAWGIEEQQERDGRPWGGFTWGGAQLTALIALTSIQFGAFDPILPDAALLASAPALKEVHCAASGEDAAWEALKKDVCQRRPDVSFVTTRSTHTWA